MSKPTFNEGQEIVFGVDDGSFQEAGFLHGDTVRVVEARYGKLDIPAQYQDPKNPIPARIAAKFTLAIQKQDGTEKILKPQEYSTGIQWDGDESTATVSPDGKRLVAKKGFKGFSKQTDFYHLLETSVNAGFPQDTFKGDLSVFDGKVFQMISEANPRAKKTSAGKDPNPKPFFGLLIGASAGTTTTTTATTGNIGKPAGEAVTITPEILAAGVTALTTMVSESPNKSVTRRDVPSKVPQISDSNGWDAGTRVAVMQALFDLPKLQLIAGAAGLKLSGETVTQ